MKLKNALVVYMKGERREHTETLEIVPAVLKKHHVSFDMVQREHLKKKDFINRDMVITIGGDGTFLSTAQHILDETLILGVNADVRKKEGFFLKASKDDFEEKFRRILKEKNPIILLPRLQAVIDRKKHTVLAANEFFVGSWKSYHVSSYDLIIEGRQEYQKSSGVIIATGAGSHCWLRSAGGKPHDITSSHFQVFVREPYKGAIYKPTILSRTLGKKDRIKIISRMEQGVVCPDGTMHEYDLPFGHTVEISMSDKPLHAIMFEKRQWKGLRE